MHPIVSWIQNEKWACEARALQSFACDAARMAYQSSNRGVDFSAASAQRDPAGRLRVAGDTAEIPITGMLMKSVPSWLRWFGFEATGYDEIVAMANKARGNDEIRKVIFRVSSPGGTISGVQDAAAAVAALAGEKQTEVFAEDIYASAALWVAAYGGQATATPITEVGSIGIYTVLYDLSEMAALAGVKVHLVSTGVHKGAGFPGTVITDEQLAAVQDVIDGLGSIFVDAVAEARSLEREAVQGIADGRVWLAAEAVDLGLIDEVGSGKTAGGAVSSAEPSDDEEFGMDEAKKAAAEETAPDAEEAEGQATEADEDAEAGAPEGDEPETTEAPEGETEGEESEGDGAEDDTDSEDAGDNEDGEGDEDGEASAAAEVAEPVDETDEYEAGYQAAVDNLSGLLAKYKDVDFCAEQFVAGADDEQVREAWIARLERRNAELERGREPAAADPVEHGDGDGPTGRGSSGMKRSEFKALVDEIEQEKGCSREEAVREARAQL